jgi:hypothetical protein
VEADGGARGGARLPLRRERSFGAESCRGFTLPWRGRVGELVAAKRRRANRGGVMQKLAATVSRDFAAPLTSPHPASLRSATLPLQGRVTPARVETARTHGIRGPGYFEPHRH